MAMPFRFALAPAGLAVLLAGCASTGSMGPASPTTYADKTRWLCLPGRQDACSAPRPIVERRADGTAVPVPDAAPVTDSGVDCFYVYPTVSMSLIPRNADNFVRNHEETARIARVQAASFRSACRLFAPLYRQGTIATYVLPERMRRPIAAIAYADVRAAFDYYMAHDNGGRKIVLMGHSQGAQLITALMKERFDAAPAMRRQLLLAIVAGGPIHVPVGGTVGGTYRTIPVCTRPGETGCIVTFKSFIDGADARADNRFKGAPGEEEACVDPATLDDRTIAGDRRRTARATLAGTLLPPPAWSMGAVDGDKSSLTFTRIVGGYSAACADAPGQALRYLAIRQEMAPGDPRREIVPFASNRLRGWLGLHVLDMQFPAAELVRLVEARAPAAAPR